MVKKQFEVRVDQWTRVCLDPFIRDFDVEMRPQASITARMSKDGLSSLVERGMSCWVRLPDGKEGRGRIEDIIPGQEEVTMKFALSKL